MVVISISEKADEYISSDNIYCYLHEIQKHLKNKKALWSIPNRPLAESTGPIVNNSEHAQGNCKVRSKLNMYGTDNYRQTRLKILRSPFCWRAVTTVRPCKFGLVTLIGCTMQVKSM